MMQLPKAQVGHEERKARLEKMVATIHLRLAQETEEERRAKREWILFGFDLDLIWIEIGVLKNKFFKGMSLLAL